MSDVKRYEITWNAHEDTPVLTVEIDHSICTDKLLHQINNFFINAEDRYLNCDCDITATVLKMLAAICFSEQAGPTGDWNTYGLICQFEDGNYEGWPPMDGSEGIKILGCDSPGVRYDDMEVEEVS
ncbi:DUF2528 family protein [Salmonella enterica]|uniref:DUF2528 family protein n=1 Tax=Salmonella enterica I TaxID=59201 RepID=A0A403QGP7_SALET|nr:DUF2528 family protein [Salmonella enterica]EAS0615008.1 DUF2528 family protein [Salmonella enterica subsp. enterica serovar Dahomey]EBX2202574.1 hypothetical protein [Salmonella enterica subsp. enterica serovar Oranienburg]EBY7079407.1 DUF2528 family protein [Salmonella enterica subsp. enterica serovar Ealing]EDN4784709.1 DUF2528 family protein [Salmonella enterica subsp. enterica]EEJ5271226.1 DUF2528 family protein [Salmonella enterica subsp. enterica serovar Poano]MIY13088.1 DUF2528 fam